MLGILVRGENHFIVSGPEPGDVTALELARHWSLIRIGAHTPASLAQWKIVSQAFRENLEWAVIAPGEGPISPAVRQLLDELRARGVRIRAISSEALVRPTDPSA